MSNFIRGFGDELTKLAIGVGALKAVGKFGLKHPVMLGVPFVLGGTAMAAKRGYKTGRRGGEKARYLPANYDRLSRRATPSRAASVPYGQLFSRASSKEKKKLSKHYKEKAFKG